MTKEVLTLLIPCYLCKFWQSASCWGDRTTSVNLVIDGYEVIHQFASFLVAVLQDALCGWVARRRSINKPVMVRECCRQVSVAARWCLVGNVSQ